MDSLLEIVRAYFTAGSLLLLSPIFFTFLGMSERQSNKALSWGLLSCYLVISIVLHVIDQFGTGIFLIWGMWPVVLIIYHGLKKKEGK